jgi:hypothetical protein
MKCQRPGAFGKEDLKVAQELIEDKERHSFHHTLLYSYKNRMGWP